MKASQPSTLFSLASNSSSMRGKSPRILAVMPGTRLSSTSPRTTKSSSSTSSVVVASIKMPRNSSRKTGCPCSSRSKRRSPPCTSAHGKQRCSVHFDRKTLYPTTVLEDDLANLISNEILLLAGDSFTDHQLHHDVLSRAKKLGHTSGELLRIELEPKFDLFLSVSPVNVLPKPTEVDDFSADPSPLRVEVPGLDRMVGQRQGMQDARLPRAVGAVDQRDRSQRQALGGSERLEVGDVECS